VERRAADYLQAAAITAPLLGAGTQETSASETYDAACGELTVLLRSADGGRLWNYPLTVTNGSESYHLRLQPAGPDTWATDYFTSFKLASSIQEKYVKTRSVAGWRCLLGCVHWSRVRALGITAPVTATLIFTDTTRLCPSPGNNQQLALKAQSVRWANYSALLYYKRINETLTGFRGVRDKSFHRPERSFSSTLRSERIPLVFVHG
jgi:hypothetical protein